MKTGNIDEMLALQHKLNEWPEISDMPVSERCTYLREFAADSIEEAVELRKTLMNRKFWMDHSPPPNQGASVEEFCDMLSALLNISVFLQLTEDDIVREFKIKWRKNYKRRWKMEAPDAR
jgi:dimeric dUTPase (all-alpha-NTP-PPase superfamily)